MRWRALVLASSIKKYCFDNDPKHQGTLPGLPNARAAIQNLDYWAEVMESTDPPPKCTRCFADLQNEYKCLQRRARKTYYFFIGILTNLGAPRMEFRVAIQV